MVALSTPTLLGRVPSCFAHLTLEQANNALVDGNESLAAVLLRESCRRYLAALAEYHGVQVPKRRQTAKGIFATLRRAGVDVCGWIGDAIDCCEQVLDFQDPDCPIEDALEVAFAVIRQFDFLGREGGEV